MSSCFSRCLRVPIAIRAFYESYLWILQTLSLTHPDLHPGLLDIALRLGAPFLVERGIDPSRAMSPRTGTRYASGSSSDLLHSEIEPPSQKQSQRPTIHVPD